MARGRREHSGSGGEGEVKGVITSTNFNNEIKRGDTVMINGKPYQVRYALSDTALQVGPLPWYRFIYQWTLWKAVRVKNWIQRTWYRIIDSFEKEK